MPKRFFFHVMTALLVVACAAPASRRVSPTVAPASRPVYVAAGNDLPREQTADEQVKHVLNRLAFGARPGDYERVRTLGVDRWIAQQLQPSALDDAGTDAFLAHFPTLGMTSAQLVAQYPPAALQLAQKRQEQLRAGTAAPGADGAPKLSPADSMQLQQANRQSYRVAGDLQASKVGRALISDRQLQEVMVDFWENHFNIFVGKGQERYMLASYDRDVIRPNALGNFRTLLGAVAKSPAMLFYLDNFESVADSGRPTLGNAQRRGAATRGGINGRRGLRPGFGGITQRRPRVPLETGASAQNAPRRDSLMQLVAARRPKGLNENYGRELLELHTLGVDGGYTQADVINAARAFTGWSIDQPRQGGDFIFRPQAHDAGQKIVLGHTLAAGRGVEDGEEVLDIVAHHPATARFIATKLVRRFVSDSAPAALVARAAEAFRATDGDIREVVRTIVTSPEFFSQAAYKSKIKSPFELVVSALRAVGAEPDTTPRTAQVVARLGQPLFGHQAPNGYPETGDAWINTGAILNRINFGFAVAGRRIPGVIPTGWPAAATLTNAPRAAQVEGVIRDLLGGEASPDTRKILESGVNPLAAPRGDVTADSLTADTVGTADEMNAADMRVRATNPKRANNGPNPLGRPTDLKGLAQVVGLALGAPEFQRR